MTEEPIDRLRRLSLSLPEATEKIAWGEPTFRVKDRVFAMFADNHHSDGHVAVWLAAPVGVQEMLVNTDPEKFFRPPYVGVKGWVGVEIANVDDAELKELLVQSYCMVAPRKLQALVGG
jgi:hypothetical protein